MLQPCLPARRGILLPTAESQHLLSSSRVALTNSSWLKQQVPQPLTKQFLPRSTPENSGAPGEPVKPTSFRSSPAEISIQNISFPDTSSATSNNGSSSKRSKTSTNGSSYVLFDSTPSAVKKVTKGNGKSPQESSTDQTTSSDNTPASDYVSYSEYYRSNNTKFQLNSTATQTSQDASANSEQNGNSARSSEVAEALARAQQAIAKAESSLDSMEAEQRNGQKPQTKLQKLLRLVARSVAAVAVPAVLWAVYASGVLWQLSIAVALAAAVAVRSYRKNSLDRSGALATFFVGVFTLSASLRLGITLLAFFYSCIALTKYKQEKKEGLEDTQKPGAGRNWVQVFCNGGVPTILALLYGIITTGTDVPLGTLQALEPWRAKLTTGLLAGFLGYYASCCGDTWASELGPLSSDTPRLITTMKPVRRGTNGGVTLLGLSASIMGGMFVGLAFYVSGMLAPTVWVNLEWREVAASQWRLIPLGLMAGLFGSVLDSLLGATVQFTGYNRVTQSITGKPGPDVTHISGLPILDNNAVNAVSATVTSAVTVLVAFKMFGFF